MTGIYKIQSIIKPQRFYIGSAFNLNARKACHVSLLINNKHDNIKMQRHVNKYGIDDFVFSVIEYCDKNILIIKEQFYIDNLHPTFNINQIAGNSSGRTVSKKTRKKISEKVSAKMPQTRLILSAIKKGRFTGADNHFFRKTHKQETKDIIGRANKGRVAWNKGKTNVYSDETLNKMKKLKTEEHKRHLREAGLKQPLTKERSNYMFRCRMLLKMENELADMLIDELNEKRNIA